MRLHRPRRHNYKLKHIPTNHEHIATTCPRRTTGLVHGSPSPPARQRSLKISLQTNAELRNAASPRRISNKSLSVTNSAGDRGGFDKHIHEKRYDCQHNGTPARVQRRQISRKEKHSHGDRIGSDIPSSPSIVPANLRQKPSRS